MVPSQHMEIYSRTDRVLRKNEMASSLTSSALEVEKLENGITKNLVECSTLDAYSFICFYCTCQLATFPELKKSGLPRAGLFGEAINEHDFEVCPM